jgi:hypothetical protein
MIWNSPNGIKFALNNRGTMQTLGILEGEDLAVFKEKKFDFQSCSNTPTSLFSVSLFLPLDT